MKASDLLVKCLQAEGITEIYGVPGEENADLMLSLEAAGFDFVLTRHEQGAAFMADAWGRLTGSPAVCLGTLGPGATNLITGVANADMDRSPLIVITGQADTTRQHKESHQVMDVVGMYRPVTKWSYSIQSTDSIPEVVRKAVRLARGEKPGAVHIELAEDIAGRECSGEPLPPRRFRRPVTDASVLDEAWAAIAAARKPIIVAGNGTIRTRASAQLRALCEQTGIGVLSTFMAKGCVDRNADYCLYTIGLQQKDYAGFAVDEADVVIAIGYDLVEYPPRLWNPRGDKRIVHIDFLPAEIDARYHPDIECVGDIAGALEGLVGRAKKHGATKFDLTGQRQVRARMAGDIAAHKDDRTEGRIRPQKVLWDVREALGPADIVLSGVGAHKMWIGRYYQCNEPGTCIIPNGFCSMGMALPGAIAAHRAEPDKRVMAIAGDGEFLMNVQEMETARRLNSDITVMVWEDGGYGLIGWKQEQEFGRHTDLSFGNPDWVALADSFGWQGQRIDNAADLAAGIDKALAYKGPALIALPIDYQENLKLTERLGDLPVAL